jgi:thiol-disulfide isomerase/thioredoxin
MNRMIVAAFAALVASPLVVIAPRAIAAATAEAKAKPAKPLHISKGAPVKLTDYLFPGKTVVFDFYSQYCGPCVQVAPALERLHEARADVVVVKVDINRPGVRQIDWDSPVVKQYRIPSVPHFKVYGPDGKLKAEDAPNGYRAREMVMAMLQKLE